jgi:hypothetical protein
MNYSRIALAAVAATVVDAVYGFLEWILVGTAIGLAYAPRRTAARKPAVGV